jgi:hypothetical protein
MQKTQKTLAKLSKRDVRENISTVAPVSQDDHASKLRKMLMPLRSRCWAGHVSFGSGKGSVPLRLKKEKQKQAEGGKARRISRAFGFL